MRFERRVERQKLQRAVSADVYYPVETDRVSDALLDHKRRVVQQIVCGDHVFLVVAAITVTCTLFAGCSGENGNEKQNIPDLSQSGDNSDEGAGGKDEGDGENMKIKIVVDGLDETFYAELYDNGAARALYSELPLKLDMSDMPHEKYSYLGFSLPTSPQSVGRIESGDIMLWGKDCLVFFYESFTTSYSYTKLGRMSGDSLIAVLSGEGKLVLTVSRYDG